MRIGCEDVAGSFKVLAGGGWAREIKLRGDTDRTSAANFRLLDLI